MGEKVKELGFKHHKKLNECFSECMAEFDSTESYGNVAYALSLCIDLLAGAMAACNLKLDSPDVDGGPIIDTIIRMLSTSIEMYEGLK